MNSAGSIPSRARPSTKSERVDEGEQDLIRLPGHGGRKKNLKTLAAEPLHASCVDRKLLALWLRNSPPAAPPLQIENLGQFDQARGVILTVR